VNFRNFAADFQDFLLAEVVNVLQAINLPHQCVWVGTLLGDHGCHFLASMSLPPSEEKVYVPNSPPV
jgi:hypothetical protein